jgi:hypothetical protein
MNDNQNIYALFNFVNDNPIWLGILNTIVSLLLGAWIVYKFNIKIENRKYNENRKLDFENLKLKIGKTIEEFRLIGCYISEYLSKAEYQIAQKEVNGYLNENLYNIRLSNFDIFRVKYAELRSVLLFELVQLRNNIVFDETYENLVKKIEKYNVPPKILFNKENIIKDDGKLYDEQEIEVMVTKKLKEENELIFILDKLKIIIPNLQYKK